MASLTHALKPLLNLVRGRPVLAIFEVCLRCNSACAYCDLPLNIGRYELTRDEIGAIFTQLYRDGIRYVFVQGGEPFVRRDLLDILDDLVRLGFSLTLVTNGTRLTTERVARLKTLPINISVSLDTLNRDHYQRIRGADQLPLVLQGIQRLADFPHPKYITCIVSQQNRHEVLDVLRFARAQGFIPVVGAYHWGIERYGKVDPELQYQRHTAVKVFANVLESGLVPRGYFRHYVRENIRWLSQGSLAPCDAGKYSIAIDASGNVAPCLALAHAGNLLQSSLADILQNFDREAIQRCSDRSSCNMLCSRVIGSSLHHPFSVLITPRAVSPSRQARLPAPDGAPS